MKPTAIVWSQWVYVPEHVIALNLADTPVRRAEALQQGEERATYGKALIERLAQQLAERCGKGFSATNLDYFRQFYLAYRDRIPHPASGESQHSSAPSGIPHPVGGESLSMFYPNLSWSHYRALMRVTDADARRFYEAVRANWSRRDLERQINSLYHQRLLTSTGGRVCLILQISRLARGDVRINRLRTVCLVPGVDRTLQA